MRSFVVAIGVFFGVVASCQADTQELQDALGLVPDSENGAKVYGLCANCHKDDGWGHTDGTFPAIAGQHRKVIIKQLADIRSRNRDNPTMFPFSDPAVIGGAQSIADVAEYISRLPPNPAPGIGPGIGLEKAEENYRLTCAGCHGPGGDGINDAFFPRLKGQHYEYAKTQLKWIRDGRRRNANWAMVVQLKGFTDEDISAIADYISRMPVE